MIIFLIIVEPSCMSSSACVKALFNFYTCIICFSSLAKLLGVKRVHNYFFHMCMCILIPHYKYIHD